MCKENSSRRWFARITKICRRSPYSKDLTESINFGVQQTGDEMAPWAEINWPADWHGRCKLELANDHWGLLQDISPVLRAFGEDAAHRLRNRIHKPITPDEICALLVLHGFVETAFGVDENHDPGECVVNGFNAVAASA